MSDSPSSLPCTRVVLLGASNARLGLARALAASRSAARGPVELLAAVGLGRSYGLETRVLGRRLCGLESCGLYDALSQRPPAPTHALLMDIGNDLLYGATVRQTCEWVEKSADRLEGLGARLSIALLPVGNLDKLSEARYVLFRTLLFPKQRASLEEISDLARELNQKILKKFSCDQVCCIEMDQAWYGFDPIHFKRTRQSDAWTSLMRACLRAEGAISANASLQSWARMIRAKPEESRLFGALRYRRQPCVAFRDGSSLSLY